MHKLLICLFALILTLTIRSQSPALTYTYVNGSNTVTCSTQPINIIASVSNYTAPLFFMWNTYSGTAYTGTNVNITNAGQYTLVAYDLATSYSLTQVVSIGANMLAPVSAVMPSSQNITCLVSAQTISATSNQLYNITHSFYAPGGGVVSVTSFSAIYTPGGPGTYTNCLTNTATGCSTCKTFTVASSDHFPELVFSNTNNYTLGCGSYSNAAVNITGDTRPAAGGLVTYTILPPGTGTNYNLGATQHYTLTNPGIYTAIVKDPGNGCETKTRFSVIQDINGPVINLSTPVPTLTCYTPSVILQASSPDAAATFSWSYYGSFGLSAVQGNTFVVNTSTNTNSPVTANFTLTGINPLNSCKTSSVIQINQNLYRPAAKISNGLNYVITCATPAFTLNNTSTTGIPPMTGFPTNSVVAGILWEGPSPLTPLNNSGNYIANVPGAYTLTVQDLNNGCISKTVTTVMDNRIYPVVVSPPPFQINCQSPVFVIFPTIVGNSANLTYTWNAGVTGLNSPSLTINTHGTYSVTVTNPINGCATTATVGVDVCTGINAIKPSAYRVRVFPNPGNGIYTMTLGNGGDNKSISIYNMLGTLVKTQRIDSETTMIDLKNELSGIYFITVTDKNEILHTTKVVKQ